MISIQNLSEEQIHQKLGEHYKSTGNILYWKNSPKTRLQPSAVLIPLFKSNGSWHVLFIRRAVVTGDAHSGQVAFPGGRPIPNEAFPDITALRETQEEIGIHPKDVRIIGHLTRTRTVTNYIIYPVVGIITWPVSLQPSPLEVSRIFTIPLDWLTKPGNFEESYLTLPNTNAACDRTSVSSVRLSSPKSVEPSSPITIPVITFKPYDGEVLWGASARIMVDFLKILQVI